MKKRFKVVIKAKTAVATKLRYNIVTIGNVHEPTNIDMIATKEPTRTYEFIDPCLYVDNSTNTIAMVVMAYATLNADETITIEFTCDYKNENFILNVLERNFKGTLLVSIFNDSGVLLVNRETIGTNTE